MITFKFVCEMVGLCVISLSMIFLCCLFIDSIIKWEKKHHNQIYRIMGKIMNEDVDDDDTE